MASKTATPAASVSDQNVAGQSAATVKADAAEELRRRRAGIASFI